MEETRSTSVGNVITALFGAVAGGIGVIALTRVFPEMMSRMMQNMMAQMGGEGCDPAEIWKMMIEASGKPNLNQHNPFLINKNGSLVFVAG